MENDCSRRSEVHNSDKENSFVSNSRASDVTRVKSAKKMDDSTLQSDSAKSAKCSTESSDLPHDLQLNRSDLQNKFSLLGIKGIVTLLGDYQSNNLNITVAGEKEVCPFFGKYIAFQLIVFVSISFLNFPCKS